MKKSSLDPILKQKLPSRALKSEQDIKNDRLESGSEFLINNGFVDEGLLAGLTNLGQNYTSVPQAYINYILFDKEYNVVEAKKLQISETGKFNVGDTIFGQHEYLHINPIAIAKEGYIYIYLSNQTPNSEVYFDDLLITHSQTEIIQGNGYYPFGLTFNSSKREARLANNYLYNNGSERETILGVYQTKYRILDPVIGRWWQIDPLADSLDWLTPYNSMDNNPIRWNDPDGDCPWCWGAVIGFSVEYTSQVIGNVIANGGEVTLEAFTNVDAQDLLVATGVGAATGGLSSLGTQFTKTAIVGGIATVNALGEGVKASSDVNVNLETGDTNINSVFDGTKSGSKAAIEFATGNIPGPEVAGKGVSEVANAVGAYVVGAVKSVLDEGINAQVKDESNQKQK